MATTNKQNVSLVAKDMVDIVANKVRQFQENGELSFPENYSPENAMKAAWLTIQETVDKNSRPAVEVCTRNSIANALLNMVVQGLNPAKKQCYFIVYGDKLTLQRSYFGAMHIAKTVDSSIEDIVAEVVYEGDVFKYCRKGGRIIISEHTQELGNINKERIIGAYCSVIYRDGSERSTVMSIDEIKASWSMSPTHPLDDKGNIKASSTHGKFTAEMCKKTVVNRACKNIINASDDSSLIIKAYKATEADIAEAEAQEEIEANANKIYVDIDTDTGEVDMPHSAAAPAADDLP